MSGFFAALESRSLVRTYYWTKGLFAFTGNTSEI